MNLPLGLTTGVICAGLLHPTPANAASSATDRLPNIVIIFTDDQGYADVGVLK